VTTLKPLRDASRDAVYTAAPTAPGLTQVTFDGLDEDPACGTDPISG
jgi:hypothetical protein